ncbi:hypothetical protein WV31_00180 [Magnetospirillum sp. ME-1]|nr:hypothetical protein WV31_00180 [Magnetospirillum sp. ME-1]
MDRGFVRHILPHRFEQFLQFTAIEPNTTALRADIDLHAGTLDVAHSDVAVGAYEQRHDITLFLN